MKLKIMTAGLIFLSACASTGYEGPTTENTALVRFSNYGLQSDIKNPFHNPAWMHVDEYSGQDCTGDKKNWDALVHMGTLWSKPQRLGIPLEPEIHKNAFTEFEVDAEKQYYFLLNGGLEEYGEFSEKFGYADKYYTCKIPMNVSFKSEGLYEIAFYQEDPMTCAAVLFEILTVDGSYAKVNISSDDFSPSQTDVGCEKASSNLSLF